MHTLHRNTLIFAVGLSALAGFVDATGYLKLAGYFVSFMSGNSTQLAISLVRGKAPLSILLGTILTFFVAGTMAGTVAAHFAPPARRTMLVLVFVTVLLGSGAACHAMGLSLQAVFMMTFAMGAVNAALQGTGDAVIGVTYMTGTLVKMGQKLAHAMLGDETSRWLPYLTLWLGLMAGGTTGALAYSYMGLGSLWIATGWTALLAVIAGRTK